MFTYLERERRTDTEPAAVRHRDATHLLLACVPRASAAFCREMQQADGEVPAISLPPSLSPPPLSLSLSLSLSHTHTHTPLPNSVIRCNLYQLISWLSFLRFDKILFSYFTHASLYSSPSIGFSHHNSKHLFRHSHAYSVYSGDEQHAARRPHTALLHWQSDPQCYFRNTE